MLRSEPNARIHAAATLLVVFAGWALEVDRVEWLFLILTIASVWSLEAVNTSIEAICDTISPDPHPQIGRAKDVAAAAVLIASIAAVLVAALIFGRRLLLCLA